MKRRGQLIAAVSLADQCGECPLSLQAAQLELTQVGEFEAGTGKEVSHRAGHEHLPGLGAIQDSGRRMDGDAAHVVALELDLAGVDAGAGQ